MSIYKAFKDSVVSSINKDAARINEQARPGPSTEGPPPSPKGDFNEVLTHLRDGTQAPPRLQKLLELTRAHTKKNLEKGGSLGAKGTIEILPGQFTTGFRQVQLVETQSFVKPLHWTAEGDVSVFEKRIYADSLAFADTKPEEMPANVDILTLDNVLNDKPPHNGKLWKPETPLYGTNSAGIPIFVILSQHPAMGDIHKAMDALVDKEHSCGNNQHAGAMAAVLSALMQHNAAALRQIKTLKV